MNRYIYSNAKAVFVLNSSIKALYGKGSWMQHGHSFWDILVLHKSISILVLTIVRTQENYVPLWFVLKNKKKQTLILHLTYVYSFIVVFTTTITDISQQNSCVRVSAAGV